MATDRTACLALFDANCPAFFAPNERDDYVAWLDGTRAYTVATLDGGVVGAYGVTPGDDVALNWIMISPHHQGRGLGGAIMARVVDEARVLGADVVHIAASQHSAPFFARYGAIERSTTTDGWGPGMHRVDMTLAV